MGQEITISRKRIYIKATEYLEDVNQGNILRPHVAFVNDSIAKNFTRSVSWRKLKNLALESKGTSETLIPNFGKIFLKVSSDPEKILYRYSPFESPKDPSQSITKKGFDSAWQRKKSQKTFIKPS